MYHRKRLAQSFCSPEGPPTAKKQKSHSPDFSKVAWDTEGLQATLQNWPTNTTVNWSAVGKEHGISGGNAGQIVKEFAKSRNIQLLTPKRKPTKRPSKIKLPGTNISIPANPPVRSIEAEIQDMISSGRFSLGEECAPYKVTKYTFENGKLSPHDTLVQARKVSLREIRQRLLDKHHQYMRVTPSQIFRSLCMWHDHATILKMGYIMVTVHVMYDPLVFLTDNEYQQCHPDASISIQAEVEQPEIHLLAAGSSSAEDQAALVGDRVSCLMDLKTPLFTESGTSVIDVLRYFTGDHPAAQFEQGSKQGGTYKCGACGCKETLFSDQAHALVHVWRPLKQLQSLAIGGAFGTHTGIIRPFHNLKVDELKKELRARGVRLEKGVVKSELQLKLDDILRGVTRVPALLLDNPTQSLSSLGLERYEVIASEPLHDLKGHIINLITELPHVLPPGETATKCNHLINCCLAKEKKSGADLRRVVIQIYLLLKDLDCSSKILLLLQTIIKVGEISYSLDDCRSPRQLLQMYNTCWLHMELCRDMFGNPKKITRSKMFGHYLHALTAHSPTQYELASLRSLNTENQERLFGQGRIIAESCTNHHLENVIPQVMLRLQAKQERHMAMASVEKGDTQVSHVAKDLPKLPGTTVKISFIGHRKDSWQIHLQRISPFLIAGEGVWWTGVGGGFHFWDGDGDSSTQSEDSFTLLHFHQNSVVDVEERRKKCWSRILEERIAIPANEVKVYDNNGTSTGRIHYYDGTSTFVPFPTGTLTSTTETLNTNTSQSNKSNDQPTQPLGESSVSVNTQPPPSLGESSIPMGDQPTQLLGKSSVSGSTQPPPSLMSDQPPLCDSHEHQGLTTALAKFIQKLLPEVTSITLTELDTLRSRLKITKNKATNVKIQKMRARYSILKTNLLKKILKKQSELGKLVKDFEQEYFLKHTPNKKHQLTIP